MPSKKVKTSQKRRPKPKSSRSRDVVKAPSSTLTNLHQEMIPGTTQLKVITNHPYENENIYFPLKIGGIIVLFSSLFFLLFTYVDPLRNIIVKVKERLFPKDDVDVNEVRSTDKSDDGEDEEENEKLDAKQVAQRKLDVVKEYVDSTKRPSLASLGGRDEIKSYCYVGEDDGLRTCIPISDADKCMSGDIFTSENMCVNPNLRHYEPEEE